MNNKLKTASLCVQGGYKAGNGEPIELPIIQSTTFKYDNSEEMALLFDLKKDGYFYTRLANPTNDAVAAKIAQLEGGVGAVLTSSGQAANFYAVFNICEAGGHIIASNEIYGGTFNLFGVTMKKLGIDCTFVSPDASEEELQAAFRPNTRAMFGETISNPGCQILDIEKFASVAHRNGVPLIVDNTFATPVNCRPFEWGADIVTHSTTKYMDGLATQVGGAVVDSGNFDWMANAEKFPGLCTPDESYHGLTYVKDFGRMGYTTKLVSQLMRDLGSIPAPQNSFLLHLGLQTLHLRMAQHCRNAQAVAEFLQANPKVAWVHYCGLPDDPNHEKALKYLPNGSCGVLAFGLKGDRETAIKWMDSLEIINIVTHVADARTCVLHPASHTHRQLSEEQLKEAGVAPDLIRLSVGIEDIDDILADISQALDRI
ncbi:MAG: O-acetylhomoserine aminocarboxypropyltransferase/cysteine synthase [Bacteroidales bacterium]|uniref:O-acetylhomoserine aminocarboxypropyltransferase/cysteine synthase family protein n=1 Tax=Candidatus Cryptobacteroides sp. TaxID=2952915 RepID=UPI002A712DFC|nr:O-acetylhomoserine aminocarboxypropyltransferase/cysteine synthase family protein [Candidatus Cryptobacteroides sp.]MBS7278031.1 O-acetylhomoserine aminocarboxypropyltransferase/cysteine synthase [Bacteroidales bacterium]MCI6526684.1 O-acetylhomoserine aminocarboxypropyltransferase/cysteine synthase [Bacteroidales bacterium]MDD5914939.1 O-acetylhomoserine aminocarboxypropyltransferase/cysteine synthase [Bacteroidales bacterium]MDD6828560.1 O-acetylhomoserine aminocarboxypropyltransferase/cys